LRNIVISDKENTKIWLETENVESNIVGNEGKTNERNSGAQKRTSYLE
jgi:hypothetical protein